MGLFCTKDYTYNLHGNEGIFYGGGTLLGVQLLGVLVEILWVGCMSSILFFSLSFAGLLRVSEEEEMNGLDLSEHEGPAYRHSSWSPTPVKSKKAAAVEPV